MTNRMNNNPLNLISNYQQNPLFLRAQQMAKGKSPEELQQIAQNICQEKGLDLNEMMKSFQSLQSLFNI